ncbi:MAG: hypothetical protein O9346_01875 [Leptospiraceae bacterium]|jgi:hypothetical protein|nr:hypothetical protein [Leptospiraceae bacterium]
MAVRPITDYWILARCKHGYFGGYPAGFLERARYLLGCTNNDVVAHIPGGMAHNYNGAGGMPLSGYGENDYRIDINPDCEPEVLMDVRKLKDCFFNGYTIDFTRATKSGNGRYQDQPKGILIDRPYTQEYANRYNKDGDIIFPNLNELVRESLRLVAPGGRVGVLDYQTPISRHVGGKCLARIAVDCGDGLNIRIFSVWIKLEEANNLTLNKEVAI